MDASSVKTKYRFSHSSHLVTLNFDGLLKAIVNADWRKTEASMDWLLSITCSSAVVLTQIMWLLVILCVITLQYS